MAVTRSDRAMSRLLGSAWKGQGSGGSRNAGIENGGDSEIDIREVRSFQVFFRNELALGIDVDWRGRIIGPDEVGGGGGVAVHGGDEEAKISLGGSLREEQASITLRVPSTLIRKCPFSVHFGGRRKDGSQVKEPVHAFERLFQGRGR